MNKDDFLHDIERKALPFLISKWVMERVPHLFGGDNEKYIRWKEPLAEELGVDARDLTIIGGACCGFSINPEKNYKTFGAKSDVDLAIVSPLHFEIAWNALGKLDPNTIINTLHRNAVQSQQSYIYAGQITTDNILELLPFGKSWIAALERVSLEAPANRRPVKARIYKSNRSLRAHQMKAFQTLQRIQLARS